MLIVLMIPCMMYGCAQQAEENVEGIKIDDSQGIGVLTEEDIAKISPDALKESLEEVKEIPETMKQTVEEVKASFTRDSQNINGVYLDNLNPTAKHIYKRWINEN